MASLFNSRRTSVSPQEESAGVTLNGDVQAQELARIRDKTMSVSSKGKLDNNGSWFSLPSHDKEKGSTSSISKQKISFNTNGKFASSDSKKKPRIQPARRPASKEIDEAQTNLEMGRSSPFNTTLKTSDRFNDKTVEPLRLRSIHNACIKTMAFSSEKVETLYRRYFFRFDQNFVNWLLILLIFVYAIETGMHFAYHNSGEHDKLFVGRGVIMCLTITIFLALTAVINWNGSSQKLLSYISYTIIALTCAIVILQLVFFRQKAHSVTEAVAHTMFFIYMIYAMLPVKIGVAVFGGCLLSISHVVTSAAANHSVTKTDESLPYLVSLLIVL